MYYNRYKTPRISPFWFYNHLHWSTRSRKQLINTNSNVHIVQHKAQKLESHDNNFIVKQEVTPPFYDVITMFIVYTTSRAFQWYQVPVKLHLSPSNTCVSKAMQISCLIKMYPVLNVLEHISLLMTREINSHKVLFYLVHTSDHIVCSCLCQKLL